MCICYYSYVYNITYILKVEVQYMLQILNCNVFLDSKDITIMSVI